MLGVILLIQARIDPVLANVSARTPIDTADVAMVERGEDHLHRAVPRLPRRRNCAATDRTAPGMDPPPADFSAPHTMAHSEEDLIYWVRNGKQGTAMPAFGDTLSDQEIRDVLSYIAAEQEAMASEQAATNPSACTVEAVPLTVVESLVGTTAPAAPTAEIASGTVAEPTIDAVTGTTQQLLACTNAMDTMRRLGLFSDTYLATEFAAGLPAGFAETAQTAPTLSRRSHGSRSSKLESFNRWPMAGSARPSSSAIPRGSSVATKAVPSGQPSPSSSRATAG